MSRHYRSTTLLLLTASFVGSFLLTPAVPPTWEKYFQDITHQRSVRMFSAKHASKHAPGLEFYYSTRLYGNPGVNVDELRFQAFEKLQSEPTLLMDKASVGNQWNPIGPANIAGRIRAIAFRPGDPSTVYAGGAAGGVFKSTNGGSSWTPMMDFAPQIPVGALAVDKNNPNVVYAGTGEPTLQLSKAFSAPSFNGVGVMKSVDGGVNWAQLPSWPPGPGKTAIHRIVLHPVSADTMVVASRSYLYKTTNGGTSWISGLPGVFTDVRYKEGQPSTVFAAMGNDNGGANNGVYRSTAGGDRYSWTKMGTNFPASDSTGRIALATTPSDPNLLYAIVTLNRSKLTGGADTDFLALMRTTNDGVTWERLTSNLPKNMAIGQAFYNLCIAISPLNKNLMFVGGYEVYRSMDGGKSFAKVTLNNDPVHVDQHVLEFVPNTETLYLGNDGGVYRTVTNGNSWDALGWSLITAQFYTVAFDPTNANRFYGGLQDHGIAQIVSLQNKQWRLLKGGDGGYIQVDPQNPNILYSRMAVEYPTSVPSRSTNGGATWKRLDSGFGSNERNYNWLQPFMLHPTDNTKLYTATQYVYLCKNVNTSASPSWTAISTDLTKAQVNESVISTLAVSQSNPNVMYVGTGDGKVQRSMNINSIDVTWTDLTTGLPNRWVTRVAIDRTNPDIAYITFSGVSTGHIFKTVNGGQSWANISGNLPDVPVNSMVISKTDPNTLFLATDLGVWYTVNSGTSWARFGTNLPNVVVYDILIDNSGQLVAGTHGRGMWVTDVLLSSGHESVPLELSLDQAYPNPLTPGTTASIRYSVPTQSDVTLTVFDVNGRMVRTLVNERKAAGRYSVAVAGNDLPQGCYFYRLSAGNSVITKKMTVIR